MESGARSCVAQAATAYLVEPLRVSCGGDASAHQLFGQAESALGAQLVCQHVPEEETELKPDGAAFGHTTALAEEKVGLRHATLRDQFPCHAADIII